MMRLPKIVSMVVVIDTASPSGPTIDRWLVPPSLSPGIAWRRERSPISAARLSKYLEFNRRATGTGTKSGSPR
jgi:hypothetical protein